jgi:hypothetical protein
MKPHHWVVLVGLVLAIPAVYAGAFLLGVGIAWNKASKRGAPPPTTIRYVDRVVPRATAAIPAVSTQEPQHGPVPFGGAERAGNE